MGIKTTDWPSAETPAETDELLGNVSGTSKRFSIKNLLEKVTLSSLSTTAKNIIGAINELNTKMIPRRNGISDFNNMSDGWHNYDSASPATNAPNGTRNGFVYQTSTTEASGNAFQILFHNSGVVYYRTKWYGTWQEWHQK